MNPEQNRRECAVCLESEPSFIHNVSKSGVFRRLCTDCLLKEHRELFCPVCFNGFEVFPPPQDVHIVCLNCPSIAHIYCSPPPPSSSAASSSSSAPPASCFICPLCSDPNFTFFPKSRVNDDVPETPIDLASAMALVAAANIAVTSMKEAAAHLKDEAYKKIVRAQQAKRKAKGALENLQDLVNREYASENNNPKKKNNDDL